MRGNALLLIFLNKEMFFGSASDSFTAVSVSSLKCYTCKMIFCTGKGRFLTSTCIFSHFKAASEPSLCLLSSPVHYSRHFDASSRCLSLYSRQHSLTFPPKRAVVFSPAHSSCYTSTTYSPDSSDPVYEISGFIIR